MLFLFFSGGGVPKDILAHVTHMVNCNLHVFLMLFLCLLGGGLPIGRLDPCDGRGGEQNVADAVLPQGGGRGGVVGHVLACPATCHNCIIGWFAHLADAILLLLRWGCAQGHPGPCDGHGG